MTSRSAPRGMRAILLLPGCVWHAASIHLASKRIEKKGPAMASENMGAKQEKMIGQVAANMPLSRDCYKNLRAMASGEKTREQVTWEITTKFKKRMLEDG